MTTTAGEPMVPPRAPSFTLPHWSDRCAALAGMNPASQATHLAVEHSGITQTPTKGGAS